MDSLATASEILTQLKHLTDGMALMHQDVDTLKHASSLQHDSSTNPGVGNVDNTTSELVLLPHTPSDDTTMAYLPSSRSEGTMWAKEMDVLEEELPPGTTLAIEVVLVTEWTNKFLNEAFSIQLTPVQRKNLRNHLMQ